MCRDREEWWCRQNQDSFQNLLNFTISGCGARAPPPSLPRFFVAFIYPPIAFAHSNDSIANPLASDDAIVACIAQRRSPNDYFSFAIAQLKRHKGIHLPRFQEKCIVLVSMRSARILYAHARRPAQTAQSFVPYLTCN